MRGEEITGEKGDLIVVIFFFVGDVAFSAGRGLDLDWKRN